MCTLNFEDTDILFSKSQGGFLQAIGLIDIRARKCFPWSIKACLHFSRSDIHIFREDVVDKKEEEEEEPVILGLPLPAFFPKFYYRLTE